VSLISIHAAEVPMAKDEQEAMDLKAFVSETLVQIIAGVDDAIGRVRDVSATGKVNPQWESSHHGKVQDVEFDVAVTVTEKSGREGGAGLKVAMFQAGAKGESTTENVAINRVRFTVPVAVPHTKKPDPERQARAVSDDDY